MTPDAQRILSVLAGANVRAGMPPREAVEHAEFTLRHLVAAPQLRRAVNLRAIADHYERADRDRRVVEALRDGKSLAEVAALFRLSRSGVFYIAARLGVRSVHADPARSERARRHHAGRTPATP